MENPLEPGKATADDNGPVVVGIYANPIEGSLARAALQEAGIQCFLFDEHMYNVEGSNLLANNVVLGGMRLMVAAEDAESAKALLSQTGEGKGAPLS